MIDVIKGDIKEVVEEIKAAKADSAARYKKIVRKYGTRGLAYDKPRTPEENEILNRHVYVMRYYHVTKHIPAYLDGFVIDYKVASDFLRKLKGYKITTSSHSWGIELYYERRRHGAVEKGVLQLYDLSHVYTGLQHIPTVQL